MFVFYYNNRWQLVKPFCANIFRVSKIDPALAMYTGEFVDYYSDSTKAVEGNYANGKKEGKFSLYFPNGVLEQSGNYANDQKTGRWEYYYENSNKRQILEFKGNEILIREFWDEDGKQLVASGNGEWFGYETLEKYVRTDGEVLNGRKHGTWKKTVPSRGATINIEKYKDGVFTSGKMISDFAGVESYNDTAYCFIEKTPKFLRAEQFQFSECEKNEKLVWEFATYPGGMTKFFDEIRRKIVLTRPLRKGIIRVQTKIDKSGKMTDFNPVSNIGHEHDLILVLQTMKRWKPTTISGEPTVQARIITFEIR
jgi:hypothetical protein